MTDAARQTDTFDIVIDETFPHAPDKIWKALTTAKLMDRWLMKPTGFEAVVGNEFTYQTTPAGAWDGTIRCRVLEVKPNRRFSYSWKGGDEANIGYGSRLETVVTFILSPVEAGTQLRLIHSGFVLPRNDTAFTNMNEGWKKVTKVIGTLAGEN